MQKINKNTPRVDVKITTKDFKFHYRVAGVIEKDEKILVQKQKGKDYYVFPGGHVEISESSYDAILREIKEEMELEILKSDCRLFAINENFYNKEGKLEHWIEYYFHIKVKKDFPDTWQVNELDKGERKLLSYEWVNISELKTIKLRPESIKKVIFNSEDNKFTHIISNTSSEKYLDL